jgi:hypothetical protein
MIDLAALITVVTAGLFPVQRTTGATSASKVNPAGLVVPTARCHSVVRAIEIRTSQTDDARLLQPYRTFCLTLSYRVKVVEGVLFNGVCRICGRLSGVSEFSVQ